MRLNQLLNAAPNPLQRVNASSFKICCEFLSEEIKTNSGEHLSIAFLRYLPTPLLFGSRTSRRAPVIIHPGRKVATL
jgi:hypothetical protein